MKKAAVPKRRWSLARKRKHLHLNYFSKWQLPLVKKPRSGKSVQVAGNPVDKVNSTKNEVSDNKAV